MKYYTPSHYTGKTKQKKILRIVFLSLLLLGILIGLAVLGNLLGERLKRAQSLLSLSVEDYTVQAGKAESYEYTKAPEKRPLSNKGGCLPLSLSAITDERSLRGTIDAAAEQKNGISITVSDASGLYFAIADAADNTALIPAARLADASSAAAAAGIPLSASVHTSYSAAKDAAVLSELAQYGFTEIILRGLTGSTLSEKQTYHLLLYLEEIRDAAPQTAVGIALSPSLFASAASAERLDTLAAYYDFLLLDLSDTDTDNYAASVRAALSTHYGSLSYYELGVLLSRTHTEEETLTEVQNAGIETVRFS